MTREEATRILEHFRHYFQNIYFEWGGAEEAFDMALQALSAEEALQADTVSREDTVTLNSPISIQADTVSVVRCKDCKHYIVEGITTQYGWCHEYKHSVNEDDYCSYGERQCNYFGERSEE